MIGGSKILAQHAWCVMPEPYTSVVAMLEGGKIREEVRDALPSHYKLKNKDAAAHLQHDL